ncbi:MAG TPA: DNA repair protein RadC [Rhodanobacteraceae bacterium]|nr:DNA repair protein RadC [Rhodanobacteraceae bacterium]
MSIRHWPDAERPREKLLLRGGTALSDAELLAVFLGSGRRGQNAVDLGRALLTEAGGLKPFLDLPRMRGVGKVARCRLLAALELGRRYLDAEVKTATSLADPGSVGRYLKARLGSYPYEVFACLFLDNHYRLIAFEELFHGSLIGADVHPREVVRRCIAHNAAAVILAHNHPSGLAEPSRDDRTITLRLREALSLIDARVIDHIVIGDGEPISLAQRGWI